MREIRQVVVASRNAYALAFPDVVLRDLVTRFEVFYGIDEPAPVALFLSCELLDELVHLAMRKADVRSFDFGFSDDRRDISAETSSVIPNPFVYSLRPQSSRFCAFARYR